MSKLIDFYKRVLPMGNLVTEDDCLISFQFGERKHHAMTKGKRMALPTQDNLRRGPELAIVHPLLEAAAGGETAVMERLRTVMAQAMHLRLTTLMGELINLAVNVGEHSKTNSEQSDLLLLLKDVDADTASKWLQICTQAGKDDSLVSVHLFIKKQARIGDRTYARGAIVSWPMYEALKKMVSEGGKKLGTVTLRNKDKDALMKLYQYVITDIDVPGKYNMGSVSDVGPSFDCMLRAVAKITQEINDTADAFERFIGNMDVVKADLNWMEELENAHSMLAEIRAIPMQDGGGTKAVAPAPIPKPHVPAPTMPVIYPELPQHVPPPPSVPAPVAAAMYHPSVQPAPVLDQGARTAVAWRPSMAQQQIYMDQYQRPCYLINGQLIPVQSQQMQPQQPQRLNPTTARMLDNAGAFSQPIQQPQPAQMVAPGTVMDANGRPMVRMADGTYTYIQQAQQPFQQQQQPVLTNPAVVSASDWQRMTPVRQSHLGGGMMQGTGY
jgi:hypothetical protein